MLRLRKFTTAACMVNSNTEHKMVRPSLQKLFPQKFELKNRQYISIAERNDAVEFYMRVDL